MGRNKSKVIDFTSGKEVKVVNAADKLDAQLERLELPFDCSSCFKAVVNQAVTDALLSDEQVSTNVSSKRDRQEAIEWWFSEDPEFVEYRNWILEVPCGFEEPEERVKYIREMILQKTTIKGLKKDMGIKR